MAIYVYPVTMHNQKLPSGFSLIELLIIVVIAGILVTLAVPSFQGVVGESQVTSATTDLYSAVLVARNEAITRNTKITLCPSSDRATCNNANWNQGWIVITGATVIKVWEGAPNLAIAAPNSITFNPDSSLSTNNATFTINQGTTTKFVIVNSLGKPRISNDGS